MSAEIAAAEEAAHALRQEWYRANERGEAWECLSGVFGERLDVAGNCVCCGFKIEDDPEIAQQPLYNRSQLG